MWVRLGAVVLVTATFGGVSACIIGPKQDDPEATSVDEIPDTGAPPVADTDVKLANDTSTGPFQEAGGEADSSPSGDTAAPKTDGDCVSDAGDAGETGCGDGGGSDAVASD